MEQLDPEKQAWLDDRDAGSADWPWETVQEVYNGKYGPSVKAQLRAKVAQKKVIVKNRSAWYHVVEDKDGNPGLEQF